MIFTITMAESLFLDCGDSEWLDPSSNLCVNYSSGMDAAYFFKRGVTLADYTATVGDVTTVDVTKLQALLDSGDAKLVKGIRMGIDLPSVITGDSFIGCVAEAPINYTRTATLKDPKVDANQVKFYDSVGFFLGGMLIHECAAGRVSAIDATITLSGGRTSPEGDELQRFEKTATWKSVEEPKILPNAAIWNLTPAAGSSGS